MKKLLPALFALVVSLFWLSACTFQSTSLLDNKYIDTNIVVYNNTTPLKYYQYVKLITNGDYSLIIDGKHLKLLKFPPGYVVHVDNGVNVKIASFNLSKLERKSTVIPVWDRSLLKNMPRDIDTNVVIYDQDNVPLKFYQYFPIIFNYSGNINFDKDGKFLWRYSEKYNADHAYVLPVRLDTDNRADYVFRQLLQSDKVLVIKSKHQLLLQRAGKTFLMFPCEFGGNPVGDKQQEGDRRTPEGLYSLIGETTQGKYGKGYLISYPDSAHIKAAKQRGVAPGGEVMIHGTSAARSNRKNWTNGCIALSNGGMDSLFKYVTPGVAIDIRK